VTFVGVDRGALPRVIQKAAPRSTLAMHRHEQN